MSKLHRIPRTGDGEPKAGVIFVHGLNGHWSECWQRDKSNPENSWPYWLALAVPGVAVYSLEYDASWSNWFGGHAMPLVERATEVLSLLETKPIGSRPMVFICHSLGGLVVKQLLRQAVEMHLPSWRRFAEQTRMVVFLATPHAGADLARWLHRLGTVLRVSPAIEDLRAHSAALLNLNDWYRQNTDRLNIQSHCFYEKLKTKHVWYLPGVKVVEEADANPGLKDVIARPIDDADHRTICKPKNGDTLLCKYVGAKIRECIAGPPRSGVGEGPAVPHSLQPPADLPDFEGRGDKLDELMSALLEGQQAAITAIDGMGGVGKSALAIHAAHRFGSRIAPDGIIYVDLGGVSESPVKAFDVMGQVVTAYRPEAARANNELEAIAGFQSVLDNYRVLLVLDNAKDAATIEPLVEHRPENCRVVITSRETIVLPGVRRVELEEMKIEDATRLLRTIVGSTRATDDQLGEIAERCGHLPLALRAAGTFLAKHRNWQIEDYLKVLQKERARLKRLCVPGLPKLEVAAVLGFSAQQLAKEMPRLADRWHGVAVFPSSFDRRAAAAVWKASEDEALEDLGELVVRNMVRFDSVSNRYSLHDLMRDVARLPLEGEDEVKIERLLEETAARHAQHYYKVLKTSDELYLKGGENVRVGLALYDLEQLNIAAGQAWAAERIEISDDATRLVAEYADAGIKVLRLRLAPRAQLTWFQAQLRAYKRLGDRRGEAVASGALGDAHRELGEPLEAIKHQEKRLKIACDLGDRRQEAYARGALGDAYLDLGETQRANEYQKKRLEIARDLPDRENEGYALGALGDIYRKLGETRRAIEHQEERLKIAGELRDRNQESYALGALGDAYRELHEPRRAIEYQEKRLKIARDLGDRRHESYALGALGDAYRELRDPRRAIEYQEQRLQIARQVGDRRQEAYVLGALGHAYLDKGEPQRAIEHQEKRLEIARDLPDPESESYALGALGDAYRELHEPQRAIEYQERRLKIVRRLGDRRQEAYALGALGDASLDLGKPRQAIEYQEKRLEIARDLPDPQSEGYALCALGNAHGKLGEPRRAIEHYEQALTIMREIDDRQGEGRSLYGSSVEFDQLADRVEAIRRMGEALRIFEQIEDPNAERARAKLAEWRGEGAG